LRWVIFVLALVAVWMAFVLRAIYGSPGGALFGVFFLLIGLLNVLFYRPTARKFFAKTQDSWPFVSKFWVLVGEKGLRFLFLGVGIIFSIGGCVAILAATVFAHKM